MQPILANGFSIPLNAAKLLKFFRGPRVADAPSLTDQLQDALAAVQPGRTGREPSQLREQVRATYDRLAAERDRGATWDGLAAPFAALGILTAEGKPPSGPDLRNAFHAERYARGGKRKRRTAKPKIPLPPRVQSAVPATPPAPLPPPASPSPALEAEGLRALLAKRRPDLREPTPINLGPEDRRRAKETDDHG